MLDSGATHNFMVPAVVKKAKLKPKYNNNYEVLLGTCIIVKDMGSCKAFNFNINELEFEADFINMELGNTDIILGIQWLKTLGKCQMDWETHELTFVYKGNSVTIWRSLFTFKENISQITTEHHSREWESLGKDIMCLIGSERSSYRDSCTN